MSNIKNKKRYLREGDVSISASQLSRLRTGNRSTENEIEISAQVSVFFYFTKHFTENLYLIYYGYVQSTNLEEAQYCDEMFDDYKDTFSEIATDNNISATEKEVSSMCHIVSTLYR